MSGLDLDIERIVLHGLDGVDTERLGDALHQALTRHLSRPGGHGLRNDGPITLDSLRYTVDRGLSHEDLADQLAVRIVRDLAAPEDGG